MRLTEAARQLQLQKWATLIQEYKDSGMKLIDWLHENNISKDQYYYWRRQRKETIISTSLPEFVELPTCQPKALPTSITQIQRTELSCSQTMATIKTNNISIEISGNASAEFIQTLLKAVAYA